MGKSAKSVKKAKLELKEKQSTQGTSLKEKKNASIQTVHKSTTTKRKSPSIEKKTVVKEKQQRKEDIPKKVSNVKVDNKVVLPKEEKKELVSSQENKEILNKLEKKESFSKANLETKGFVSNKGNIVELSKPEKKDSSFVSQNDNKVEFAKIENKEFDLPLPKESKEIFKTIENKDVVVKKEENKQSKKKNTSPKTSTTKKSSVKKKMENTISKNIVPPLEIPQIKSSSNEKKEEEKPSVNRMPQANAMPVKKNGQVVGQVKKKTSSVRNVGIAHANTGTSAKPKGSFELPKKKSTISAEDRMLKLANELKEENKKKKEQTKDIKKKVSSQEQIKEATNEKDLLQNIVHDIEEKSLLIKEEPREETEQAIHIEEKPLQKRVDKYAHQAVPLPSYEIEKKRVEEAQMFFEEEPSSEVEVEQQTVPKDEPFYKEDAKQEQNIEEIDISLKEETENEKESSFAKELIEETPEKKIELKEEGDLYLESPLTEEQIAATEEEHIVATEVVPEKEKKKKEKKRLTKVGFFFKVLAWISLLFCIVSTTYFMRRVFLIDLVPVKYLYIAIFVLSIIGFILLLFAKSRKKILHFLQIIISLVLGALFFFGAIFIMKSENSLRSLFSEEEDKTTYYVLSLKESEYDSLESLENHVLGIMKQNSTPVKEALNQYKYEYKEYEAVGALTNSLITNTEELTEALVIDSNIYESLPELDSALYEQVRVIYEFELHVEKEDDAILEVVDAPIEQDPEIPEEQQGPKRNPNLLDGVDVGNSYIIYISGIDGGGYARPYGLSDVNILVVVNPDTHKVLLVSTPRDYYVQVAGTTGMKDKLTHAGLYGINASIGTIQNLYGVKIQNYVKVTFGAIETLVDDIGGITVYSDTAFQSFHKKGWYVEKGMNYMDGSKALAYSRERYAYAGGDRHRIKNQQDVIAAIIKKVATDPQQLLKFNDILNDMNPYISTDISYDRMQQMVKEQLNTLRPWSVSSISVNGTNGSAATASWPSQITYVMYPTESTIVEAQAKIVEVMTGA